MGVSRWRFIRSYWLGNTRWDTGIVPPEVTDLIESKELAPGKALDIGCGTGTTSVYLSKNGWEVTGIDFVPKAVRKAKRRAKHQQAKVAFRTGDVTKLDELNLARNYALAIDIGCGHALGENGFSQYVEQLASHLQPGATYMLYAFTPRPDRTAGLPRETVKTVAAPFFDVTWETVGEDGGWGAVWYRFKRL